MEDSKIINELIVWGIGFIVVQITLFIAFIYRMNIRVEIMKRENELMKEEHKQRNQIIDEALLEIRTDLEDHRLAFEKRLGECVNNVEKRVELVSDNVEKRTGLAASDLAKKQDAFQKANDVSHKEIMKSVEIIKDGISEIGKTVAYMSGVLDQHIGNNHTKTPPIRRKKV